MRADAASGAQSAALAAVLEAFNTGQRRMVAHMNANNKEVSVRCKQTTRRGIRQTSGISTQHRDKRLSCAERHWLQVLRAMRGELSKEIKRLETTYAANDARVVHLVNASAGRMQARPSPSPLFIIKNRNCQLTLPQMMARPSMGVWGVSGYRECCECLRVAQPAAHQDGPVHASY